MTTKYRFSKYSSSAPLKPLQIHALFILVVSFLLYTTLHDIIVFPPNYYVDLRGYWDWYMFEAPDAPYPTLLVKFLLAVIPALSWISGIVLLISVCLLIPRWRGLTNVRRIAFAGILLAGIAGLAWFFFYSRTCMPYYLYMLLFPDMIIAVVYLGLFYTTNRSAHT